MDALYAIADAIVRFMDASPPLPVSLVYLAIAAIPVTLLHELGHAVAARRLLGGDVDVSIGTTGKLAELQLGRIALDINALADPSRTSGAAEFDASRATARDMLNLVPLRLQERRDGPSVRTDGRLALDALRVARALR
jgi:hypothetical protein